MQRDAEVEIEGVDKTGGFIGTLWLNKTENAALELVREGLATIHTFSAENLSWSKELFEAEVCTGHFIGLAELTHLQSAAKKAHKNVKAFAYFARTHS
jgi:hypothetical protein